MVREAEFDTWGRDRIRVFPGQLFVHAGATLTWEPGTPMVAQGPSASKVVERGARIVAEGRPEAPVVLTCDGPVGGRDSGCWGGLIVPGQAPSHPWNGTAPGVNPPARVILGGDDPADSSGTLRCVRVELAGSDARGGGVGFYGVGVCTARSGTPAWRTVAALRPAATNRQGPG